MRFVIDANEFIIAFGVVEITPSKQLLRHFSEHPSTVNIFICRSIVNEVQRNLIALYLKQFYEFLSSMVSVDEDYLVPFELGAKYEGLGLKPGDAFITAYAEHVKANLLVSENRHFLSRRSDLPFRVVTAIECLKQLKGSH